MFSAVVKDGRSDGGGKGSMAPQVEGGGSKDSSLGASKARVRREDARTPSSASTAKSSSMLRGQDAVVSSESGLGMELPGILVQGVSMLPVENKPGDSKPRDSKPRDSKPAALSVSTRNEATPEFEADTATWTERSPSETGTLPTRTPKLVEPMLLEFVGSERLAGSPQTEVSKGSTEIKALVRSPEMEAMSIESPVRTVPVVRSSDIVYGKREISCIPAVIGSVRCANVAGETGDAATAGVVGDAYDNGDCASANRRLRRIDGGWSISEPLTDTSTAPMSSRNQGGAKAGIVREITAGESAAGPGIRHVEAALKGARVAPTSVTSPSQVPPEEVLTGTSAAAPGTKGRDGATAGASDVFEKGECSANINPRVLLSKEAVFAVVGLEEASECRGHDEGALSATTTTAAAVFDNELSRQQEAKKDNNGDECDNDVNEDDDSSTPARGPSTKGEEKPSERSPLEPRGADETASPRNLRRKSCTRTTEDIAVETDTQMNGQGTQGPALQEAVAYEEELQRVREAWRGAEGELSRSQKERDHLQMVLQAVSMSPQI